VAAGEPLWLVYTPLLTYRHEDGEAGTELIPGLAEDLPEVSDGGLTYKLRLREGLRYSDGSEVIASDFEHAVKRLLTLGSPAAALYDEVDGVRAYLSGGDPEADISGIHANDRSREIEIEIAAPDASFANALATWSSGLVPGDTVFADQTANPPPGVGAYEITVSEPGRRFVLEKAAEFEELDIPDIPTGNADTITVEIRDGIEEQEHAVLADDVDYMRDAPPSTIDPTLADQAGDRYATFPTGSTYYFFLNARTAPFDDARVREAANYAIDKPTLAGLIAGGVEPGCSFLPPAMPGFDEDLDTTACPYGDPTEAPDSARARELIAAAGARGERVTVWGTPDEPSRDVTEAYARMLARIGLDTEPKIVSGPAPAGAQTGFAARFQVRPHPVDFFSQIDVDDPDIDEEVARLNLEPDLDSVAEDWVDLNRALVSPPGSYVVPFGHATRARLLSDRLDPETAVFHPVFFNDYSSFELEG
jgi:peptide/nickel transport system substrate-binding protein